MTSSPPPVLELTALTRRFGRLLALDDVGLSLAAGARHAVIGPNGAGKSTLLNLVAGTDRPDHGTVALDGRDVTRLSPAGRCRLGIGRSFQQPLAVPELTVLENVVLAGWPRHPRRRGAWRSPAKQRLHTASARRWLETVGLADRAGLPAGRLAHGERRLLDLAAALAAEPSVLLLDEPAAGLTDDGVERLTSVLDALDERTAVVLVEHHVEVVARFARTVTVLAAGRVLVTGPARETLARPEVRDAYRGTGPVPAPPSAPRG
ncbi:ABC transporter ATP-binding protein [Streptomyces sp. NPDC101249]|uniref:ABC transporter ATP-binding protein n=1 Tax=Streptomyces sp. NPDC101249 TaxID=3366140 RepID=UPI0038097F1F